jgi:hypothetical protein
MADGCLWMTCMGDTNDNKHDSPHGTVEPTSTSLIFLLVVCLWDEPSGESELSLWWIVLLHCLCRCMRSKDEMEDEEMVYGSCT